MKDVLETYDNSGMVLALEHIALSWKNRVYLEYPKDHSIKRMFLSQVSIAHTLTYTFGELPRG